MIEYNAKRQSFIFYLRKCWEYRFLTLTFLRRDLKIKYAQTFIGLAWTLIQPIALATVYFIFFQLVLPIKTEHPYILFVFSGVILWNVFSTTLLQSSLAIQQNQDLIGKMYFPKSILFISKAFGALLDGLIGWILLFLLNFYYTETVAIEQLFSLFLFIPTSMFSLGLAFIVARIALLKRDILLALPFFVQLSIWFTPVFYPLSYLPEYWAKWIAIYPVNASMDGVRAFFFKNEISWFSIGFGSTIGIVVLLIGMYLFSKAEEKMMDEL